MTKAKMETKKLKITLVKSSSGRLQEQRATITALGLHKLNSSVIQPDNACTRGMIFKVRHLVTVEEV